MLKTIERELQTEDLDERADQIRADVINVSAHNAYENDKVSQAEADDVGLDRKILMPEEDYRVSQTEADEAPKVCATLEEAVNYYNMLP